MDDLIAALQIFRNYTNAQWPTHCEHDVMYVGISPDIVSEQDQDALEKLRFFPDSVTDMFASFRFGSC